MQFTWRDGERTIRFGSGTVAELPLHIGEHPYTLLTTERAAAQAPAVVEGASAIHHVPPGLVDEVSAALLDAVEHDLIVALGGGRVIDTAKAIAGVRGPDARVTAIPTTISAAEMTASHRLPKGREQGARFVRPALVINDPDLSASQPVADLAASSANALAHAIEATVTTLASPVPTLAAREAQRLIDSAWLLPDEDPGPTGREQLAQAAVLSGYAIGAARYGLSHVMSQTLVRVTGVGHGAANAAVLPVAIDALERRFPGRVDPDGSLRELAAGLARRAGADGIRRLGVPESALEECAAVAVQRRELELTPPRADEAELRELYARAW